MTAPDLASIDALIARALAEDVGGGDVTTLATIPANRRATATFLAKENGVLAGLAVAERVFAALDPEIAIRWDAADGDAIAAGTQFGTVDGPARSILVGERLALNLMQRMSGIATATRAMAEAAGDATILDTRKTAPGLRVFDKWAVRLGGGTNHRIGLYDMFLIKDNHIAAAGGIRAAIEAARRYRTAHASDPSAGSGQALAIEIETRTLAEVDEVLAVGGVDRVLLDNMVTVGDDGLVDVTLLAEAVRRIDSAFEIEASGNVTLATVAAIAATGVDFISSGALTHSVRALDISLKIDLA
ncbi:MAG: carboxylating nicotinate-nucleotide diphosphorylase [Rhodothermales bacterium]